MFKKWLVYFVAVLACAALWGCGSGGGSGGSDAVVDETVENLATLGVLNCVKCHSSTSPETISWLESAHGNSNGRMRYGEEPHDEDSSCSPCHNQLLDGDKMAQAFPAIVIGQDSDGNDIFANVSRDIVTCESCHGPGSAHRGVGAIPYARPDWEQCVACHDHGEGVRHADDHGLLASSVGASAHNNSAEGTDGLHASRARCQRCHTAEGAVEFANYTGDADVMHQMDEFLDDAGTIPGDNIAPLAAEEDLHPVTCAACHIPHDDSGRWESFIVNQNDAVNGGVATNWDPNNSGTADQFDFCTSCHTFYNQDGDMVGGTGMAKFYHSEAWYRMITSTHFDDPATTDTIEGYVVRELDSNPCFDCHGHELRTNTRRSRDTAEADDYAADYGYTIHTQWASSAHAGFLLDQKYAADPDGDRTVEVVDAVMAAGVTEETGAGWVHYNWDEDGRQSCQECHTSTGAMNYLNDPATYDAAANDFSHLDGWVGATGSPQNEVLYCWGCHENSGTGVLRNPGANTRPYAVNGTDVTLPDVGSSNICINCHGARGNMEEYGLAEDPTTAVATNAGFGPNTANVTEAHYLVAAATTFAADTRIGYEYTDPATSTLLDYAPVPYFAHDAIAIDELDDDGNVISSGPCAACHMQTEGSHFFAVVDKDDMGVITGLNSTVCIDCHDGEHGAALVTEDSAEGTAAAAAAFLEAEAEGYHEALEILRVGLGDLGINFQAGYPYFDTTAAGSWINEGNFGAAHNYNYLHHEPGAYAHNRYYAKRLLFDSIDWIDNYTLDGSITVDATTYPEAAHWFGADETTGVATRP